MNCCNQPMAISHDRSGFYCCVCRGSISNRAYRQACEDDVAATIDSGNALERLDPSMDRIMAAAESVDRLVMLGARTIRSLRALRPDDPALLNAIAEMIVAARDAKPN